ncbi:MAG: phosphoglucosamine mutase [Candidatus Methanomethylicia archaeon]|jgi:phosphoglucosamine mutase|nr:phosphoglucosamine mutase [Candidatus Methanomethylicia archaeon]
MKEIISSSGIRGLAISEISPEFCMKIGIAISNNKKGEYVIGHDVRLSSYLLANSLANGICAGGSDSIFIGLSPTPAIAFYARNFTGGIVITASHNPPEYNGLKIFNENGIPVTSSFYENLIKTPINYSNWDSLGNIKNFHGIYEYIDFLISNINTKRKWKIGLDPGNGTTSLTAPLVFHNVGHEVRTININLDGRFPGRGAEPNEQSSKLLSDLIRKHSLDVGFAYDGDGDRVLIIDENGNVIPQDIALAYIAKFMFSKLNKPIVVNVDTSSIVDFIINSIGGKVYRSKVGDPYIVEEIIKKDACFGGEPCGAWIFPDIIKCPDGVLSSIIFLNFLDHEGIKPSELLNNLPNFFIERKNIPCKDKISTMKRIMNELPKLYPDADISYIDGIRISWDDFTWVLIRPSGTEPLIRITIESMSKDKLKNLISSITKFIIKGD